MGTAIKALMNATGWSETIARAVLTAVLFLTAIGAIVGLKVAYDHKIIGKHDAKIELQTQQKIAPATDNASAARANDTILITENERQAHSAVHSVPDAAPSAPSVRLGCDRLRRAGKDVSRVPACAGYSGGN